MAEYKRFTGEVILIYITNFLISAEGFILLPIIAKNLSTSGYGIWIQANVTLSLLAPLSTLGLAFALIRFLSAEKNTEIIREKFFSIFFTVFFAGILFSIIILIFAQKISNFIFGNDQILVIQIIALTLPFSANNVVLLNFFRAFRYIRLYSFISILQSVCDIIIITVSIKLGGGIIGVIFSFFIIKFLLSVFMLLIIVSKIGIKMPKFHSIKTYLNFGLPAIPTDISTWIIVLSNRYIIGILMNISSVGIYSASYSLGYVISFIIDPLIFVLTPTLSKFYDENKHETVKVYLAYSLKYFLAIAIPAVFGISVLSKPLLLILTTPDFVIQGCQVTPIIALSTLIFGVTRISMLNLVLVKRTKLIAITWGFVGLLNISLNLILIPFSGLIGAAISTLLAFSIGAILITYFAFKQFSFIIDLIFILKVVLASFCMASIISISNPSEVIDILIRLPIGILIYIVFMLLFRSFSEEEVKYFKRCVLIKNS